MEHIYKQLNISYGIVAGYMLLYTYRLVHSDILNYRQQLEIILEQWKNARNLAYLYFVFSLFFLIFKLLSCPHEKQLIRETIKYFVICFILVTFSIAIIFLLLDIQTAIYTIINN